MPCPFYKDYTRECVVNFEAIINFITYDICEADDEYKDCIVYNAIVENKPICPAMDDCIGSFKKISMRIILKLMNNAKILKIFGLTEYCFSTNNVNCARYKCIMNGEKAPSSLRPDGSEIELKELLTKALK